MLGRLSLESHLSQTTEDLLGSLILLDVLAEWTVAMLHVRELILILDEEAAAVFTHRDGHIWNHVLEVPSWQVWTEVRHVLNEDFLEAHAPHDFLSDENRAIGIR